MTDQVEDSEESTDEDEDEDGNLLTHEKDLEIMKTLAAIRKKDPALLDPSSRFYSKGNAANDEQEEEDSNEETDSHKSKKKYNVADALRNQVLEGYLSSSDEESGNKRKRKKETSVQEQVWFHFSETNYNAHSSLST